MKAAAILGLMASVFATSAGAVDLPLIGPYEGSSDLSPNNEIDRLVFGQLRELGIQPARVCSDAVFVRRVYLDVIGTLPTEQEARQFLASTAVDKRRTLIDELLARHEFAVYWAMKWADLLRIKAEFPINLWPNAVHAYHRWLVTRIEQNRPYDQLARQILTASGSNFRDPPVNFYRAVESEDPERIAEAIALVFLGERTRNWPPERLRQMAVFFRWIGYKNTAEWKEEIVFFDSLKAAAEVGSGGEPEAGFPDGTSVRLGADRDPRTLFADWLLAPGNPWFARNLVNRYWFWLLGRGIIHEPDDVRPDNPPSHPQLLAYLEGELVGHRYDVRHLCRLILNSKTYQLSSIPRTKLAPEEAHCAYYPLRRLEAEVLADALCQITGTTEEYSSEIPEPFSFVPTDQRSIALADGSISSSFLELFGRPPRDTGLESERNNRASAAQRLHLLNSSHIRRKIEQGPSLQLLLRGNRQPGQVITRLYLTILSRLPTESEFAAVQKYAEGAEARGREVLIDVVWALINSPEFLYRH